MVTTYFILRVTPRAAYPRNLASLPHEWGVSPRSPCTIKNLTSEHSCHLALPKARAGCGAWTSGKRMFIPPPAREGRESRTRYRDSASGCLGGSGQTQVLPMQYAEPRSHRRAGTLTSFCSGVHGFSSYSEVISCLYFHLWLFCAGSFKRCFPGRWTFGVVIFGGKTENYFGPKEKAFPKKEIVCRKAPFSFYLNILNISRRNIHCTLMVKRYKFITSYKNYHLKVILFI